MLKYKKLEKEMFNKKIIFSSGDHCKICANPVWYYSKQWYKRNDKYYVTCPTCNNEIQITE